MVRPVGGIDEPQGGPGSASERRVLYIEDEKAVVILGLRLESYGEAARRCIRFGLGTDAGIDSYDGRVLRSIGKVLK